MPSSESEYPLTLAEVLFEELETIDPKIDETLTKDNRANADAGGMSWDDLAERIQEIRDLPTLAPKQIGHICEREKIEADLSAEDLSDVILKCKKELSKRLLPKLYKTGRGLPHKRSALCLSGGGVRSAVFNLGVLQGLAQCKLLEKFDYLSTVSGGGFIGGWLTAWIYREEGANYGESVGKVAKQLATRTKNPLRPEPDPLYNLRIYANYLTPKKGLLSADTWTLVAVYLRNLLLNWMVFVPVIIAVLMVPRIWVAFVKSPYLSANQCLIIGFVAAVIALIYIGVNLPSAKQLNLREGWFLSLCLLPLVISSMALTTYWVRLGSQKPGKWHFTLFALLLAALPWSLNVILRIIARLRAKREDGESVRRTGSGALTASLYAAATALILVAFAITGLVTWYVVTLEPLKSLTLSHGFARTYAGLAVPLLLILLTLGGTLIAGFTSRFTEVDDQEWWARSGAWILIVVLGWSLFHLVVLFGPSLFIDLMAQIMPGSNPGPAAAPHTFADCCALLLPQKPSSWWASAKGIVTALAGIVSGAITLFGGYSSKTAANGEPSQDGWKPKLVSIGMSLAATTFAVFLLILLALGTNWILASGFGEWAGKLLHARTIALNANDPRAIIYDTPGRLLVALAILIGLAGWVLGCFINTNRFSLHYYWRNRIMRAYLGVSRKQKADGSKKKNNGEKARDETKNWFTDFDRHDNLQMYELKQKPLHVVNVTLNLVGGEKLEWQDRKAESFTISPLHSGSFWLGYRDSRDYGGTDGISLATSIAISGAAASPNMGYMMTSPVIRFIMTLFNIRLGFWLGNPGLAGSGNSTPFNRPTFDRDSPTQSVRPIVAEALGMTDAHSPYVYLSDGGHFDNFGLYEMIVRRCRFIVVCDASTDEKYAYDSLAMAIRQIRVDFGVPIEMDGELNFGKDPNPANSYCATGKIRYSCVDNETEGTPADPKYDGVLIYIKPSLNGTEPADVLNYHTSDKAFPQDTIVDQWFSEPQFESYRALGNHMIRTIWDDSKDKEVRGDKSDQGGESGQITTPDAVEAAFEEFETGARKHVTLHPGPSSENAKGADALPS